MHVQSFVTSHVKLQYANIPAYLNRNEFTRRRRRGGAKSRLGTRLPHNHTLKPTGNRVCAQRRLYIGIAFTWLKMASTEKSEWRCLERNKKRFKTAKGVYSTQKESIKCSIDCLVRYHEINRDVLGEAHGGFSDLVRQNSIVL